ncbi:MAG: aminodeoxychorismate synthase component I [Hellea sp.]|nr:aminodeoxychorismate synthase component I [Hellea sp.]
MATSSKAFLFSAMTQSAFILLDDQLSGQSRFYENPVEIIQAFTPDELLGAIKTIQDRLDAGWFIAGYISYEAGLVLEPKLNPRFQQSTEPLLIMGVFDNWSSNYPEPPCEVAPRLDLKPDWQENDYIERFKKVIDYIKAGDIYQVNLTFPLTCEYSGSALCLYDTLRARQPVHYGGVISLGGPDIVSFSPELFFDKEGDKITMRPMKGTVKRLLDPSDDLALCEAMRHDEKSMAENLMIVDLLRNDLSRIAEKASVNVPHLFSLETYPTLHQMTSTVTAELPSDISALDLFKNLFPCGSVTGAPKIRAMEIIDDLESGPRGPYCGAIGYMDPSGKACFNVAIRTAILSNNQLRYHVGSGVVLDSDVRAEYEECLLKAKVLSDIPSLVETFRWDPENGIIRRKRHFARLANSARSLGYEFNEVKLQTALQTIAATSPQKCRLILSENGSVSIEQSELIEFTAPVRLSLSQHPLSLRVQEYRHKVLARDFYDGERARLAALTGCDEAIFLNPDGEICEGSFTTIFALIEDELFTPPLSSGLLPGILRAELVETGKASQKILGLDDLKKASEIYVGNSLRGLMTAQFLDFEAH